jgi:hypothetical protein
MIRYDLTWQGICYVECGEGEDRSLRPIIRFSCYLIINIMKKFKFFLSYYNSPFIQLMNSFECRHPPIFQNNQS